MAETSVRDDIDLEEEEPEELSADEERELPGPVQLYLREIGAVALLKAADEVRLAKEIEHGRLLSQLQRELTANGQHLTYDNLAHYILERSRSCADRLEPFLEIGDGKPSLVLFSPQLQRAIGGEIDEALAEALADVLGSSARQVMEDLLGPLGHDAPDHG